jgi:hypothetical protein
VDLYPQKLRRANRATMLPASIINIDPMQKSAHDRGEMSPGTHTHEQPA